MLENRGYARQAAKPQQPITSICIDGVKAYGFGGYSTGMPLAESVPQLDEVRVLDVSWRIDGKPQPRAVPDGT